MRFSVIGIVLLAASSVVAAPHRKNAKKNKGNANNAPANRAGQPCGDAPVGTPTDANPGRGPVVTSNEPSVGAPNDQAKPCDEGAKNGNNPADQKAENNPADQKADDSAKPCDDSPNNKREDSPNNKSNNNERNNKKSNNKRNNKKSNNKPANKQQPSKSGDPCEEVVIVDCSDNDGATSTSTGNQPRGTRPARTPTPTPARTPAATPAATPVSSTDASAPTDGSQPILSGSESVYGHQSSFIAIAAAAAAAAVLVL